MYGKSCDALTGLIGVDKRPAGLDAVVAQEAVYDDYRYLYGDGMRRLNAAATPALYDGIAATPGPLTDDPWGEVVRGRESEAATLFQETLGWWASLHQEGVIESFEPVFLEPHGGDLAGFILVRGDAEKLASLRVSEEFVELSTRVGLIVDKYGVVAADMGERLQRQVEYYTEQIAAFA